MRSRNTVGKSNKAIMAKFSILKGVRLRPTPMRMTTLKCAGECTCRCCK